VEEEEEASQEYLASPMIRPGGTVETEETVPCGAPYTPLHSLLLLLQNRPEMGPLLQVITVIRGDTHS